MKVRIMASLLCPEGGTLRTHVPKQSVVLFVFYSGDAKDQLTSVLYVRHDHPRRRKVWRMPSRPMTWKRGVGNHAHMTSVLKGEKPAKKFVRLFGLARRALWPNSKSAQHFSSFSFSSSFSSFFFNSFSFLFFSFLFLPLLSSAPSYV